MGQSHLRAKYSKEIKKREDEYLIEKTRLQKENIELKEKVEQATKPLVFVEDFYDQLYKIAWLKLNKIDFKKGNLENIFNKNCDFIIHKTEGATNLAGFLRQKNIDYFKGKKIVGLFDFDEAGVEQFKCIKNETYWNTGNLGEKITGYYKKRSDHDAFYTLLLPIPRNLETLADLNFPSFVEVENLLPESFLLNNKFAIKQKTTGNVEYIKIKEDKKSNLWEKALDLTEADYANFKPLFDTVKNLFKN